jgi:amino acid transporter
MVAGEDRARMSRSKIGDHAAWAMAVGGMIGGGIYTVTGVLLGTAGVMAWLALALGAAIALITLRGYARLTIATQSDAVPVSVLSRDHATTSRVLAWGLVAVYILSLAVYTFTVGHYLGRALGLGELGIVLCEAVIVGVLIVLNLRGIESSARVQVIAVWVVLAILAAISIAGLVRWELANVMRGTPEPSLAGIIAAACGTFIAFEGFEMLAYDVRDVQRPRKVLRRQLPRALIVVAVFYAAVTIGAASLVGADRLIANEDAALALAGEAIAGTPGMFVVTFAACASATSAINATLFSTSRLARSLAEHGQMPRWCASCNAKGVPHRGVVLIGSLAVLVAATVTLRPLVAIASLGFLALFCIVNLTAAFRLRRGRWLAVLGAIAAGVGAVVVIVQLAA